MACNPPMFCKHNQCYLVSSALCSKNKTQLITSMKSLHLTMYVQLPRFQSLIACQNTGYKTTNYNEYIIIISYNVHRYELVQAIARWKLGGQGIADHLPPWHSISYDNHIFPYSHQHMNTRFYKQGPCTQLGAHAKGWSRITSHISSDRQC